MKPMNIFFKFSALSFTFGWTVGFVGAGWYLILYYFYFFVGTFLWFFLWSFFRHEKIKAIKRVFLYYKVEVYLFLGVDGLKRLKI